MKWLLFFTLIFATGFPAMARKPATAEIYSGHITDGQGNGVEYATIVLLQDEIQKAGTTTDNKGNFTMEAKAGTYKVIVRCIGYEPLQKELLLAASMHDTLSLKASSYALKEVVVQAKKYRTQGRPLHPVRLPFRRERRYRIIVAGSRRMAGRR